MYAVISLTPDRTAGALVRNFENGYWFIATMTGLILTTLWASGVRNLSAHGIRNWKARASYLGIALPLAYLCPACVLISLALMNLDRQLSGLWGVLLILFSLLVGVISRGTCLLIMRKSELHKSEPEKFTAEPPSA